MFWYQSEDPDEWITELGSLRAQNDYTNFTLPMTDMDFWSMF